MAEKNVHLTEAEATEIAKNIENIGKWVEISGKNIDETLTYLVSNSKGEEIDLLRDLGKKLCIAIGDVATCALEIGMKIGNYIMALVQDDKDAAQKIRDSFN